MHDFLSQLYILLREKVGNESKLQRCLREELMGDLFRQYGYTSDDDKRARSALYCALDALAEPGDYGVSGGLRRLHLLGAEAMRNLYRLHAAVGRISNMTSPAKLEVLNAMLNLPCVDMTLLVNDWLAGDLRPGQNRMLVYVANSGSLALAAPSSLAEGVQWTRLASCFDVPTLRDQFGLIDQALADIALADKVVEPTNSEGFPGPVAGFGGH